MAASADFFYRELAGYLTERAGVEVTVIDEPGWRERERLLDSGEAHLGFVCGLQYVRKVDAGSHDLELLAAPVMKLARYGGKPVYFSDVVTRRDRPFRSLSDLRGTSWACNEPTSHSGCNLIRYHLAARGESADFFQEIIESGSHQNSLAMLLGGRISATAIDSTVLELELRLRPELGRRIRVIETLGPSPAPPAVVSAKVRSPVIDALRSALLAMRADGKGASVLDSLSLDRFERVSDKDYDPIRSMDEKARLIPFALLPPETPGAQSAGEFA